mgnify:CR=1 FL=1
MKIAYLGPEKTFTEQITRKIFPEDELIPLQPIRNVIMAVEDRKLTYGVVPLENLYNGYVINTLDTLTKCKDTKITREVSMKITHCLGALKNHDKIERIYSKSDALEQCDEYLFKNFPDAKTISVSSTAEAITYLSKNDVYNFTAAAIASKEALLKSGLEIIAGDICPNNITRFAILERNRTIQTGDDKTIITIHPIERDKPGVLADCLNILRSQHINLECIFSRPDRIGNYYFYAELNGHKDEERVKRALTSIEYSLNPKSENHRVVNVLGSFPNSHWKENK